MKSTTLLSASPESTIDLNCSDTPCLYWTNNGVRTVLGDLSRSEYHQCDYSIGLLLDSFSVVHCVNDTNIDYLEKASVFYRTQSCSRNKCDCVSGYVNVGWQCVAMASDALRAICVTVLSPITVTSANVDLGRLKNDVQDGLKVSSLLIDNKTLEFSSINIYDHIAVNNTSKEIYIDITYNFSCEDVQCDLLKIMNLPKSKSMLRDTLRQVILQTSDDVNVDPDLKLVDCRDIEAKENHIIDLVMRKIEVKKTFLQQRLDAAESEANAQSLYEMAIEIEIDNAVSSTVEIALGNIGNNERSSEDNNVNLDSDIIDSILDGATAGIQGLGSQLLSTEVDEFGEDDFREESGTKTKRQNSQEEQVIAEFATLTTEELARTFGPYKPIASLNPYIVKLDPCRTIQANTTLFDKARTMTFIKHERLFRINEFDLDNCVGELRIRCLDLAIVGYQTMKDELQIQVSREGVFVNIQLNLDRWKDYLAFKYTNAELYPDYTKWASNPVSQIQLRVTLRKYRSGLAKIDTNVEEMSSLLSIIVPRDVTCELLVESTFASDVRNYYREVRVLPDETVWGSGVLGRDKLAKCPLCLPQGKLCAKCPDFCDANGIKSEPIFQCDFRSYLSEGIWRVIGNIFAVQTYEVKNIRQLDDCGINIDEMTKVATTNMTGVSQAQREQLYDYIKSTMAVNCFIIEYSVEVKTALKMVNNEPIEASLDKTNIILLDELRYLLKNAPGLPQKKVISEKKRRFSNLSDELKAKADSVIREKKTTAVKREKVRLPARYSTIYFSVLLGIFTLSYK